MVGARKKKKKKKSERTNNLSAAKLHRRQRWLLIAFFPNASCQPAEALCERSKVKGRSCSIIKRQPDSLALFLLGFLRCPSTSSRWFNDKHGVHGKRETGTPLSDLIFFCFPPPPAGGNPPEKDELHFSFKALSELIFCSGRKCRQCVILSSLSADEYFTRVWEKHNPPILKFLTPF